MRLATLVLSAIVLALLGAAAPASAGTPIRHVLYVGNNWDGTADVLDPVRFDRLARINIVPDLEARLAEIRADPERQGYFLAVREAVGEGHDQLVDDMFSSHDGTMLFVSRPSLADVVGIDLRSRKIVWRTKVDGNRADHMGISPDGRQLLVSASTAKDVMALDPATGKVTGRFPSGDQPHENNYSADGKLIYHASIGTVFTPNDDPALDGTKGERVFEIVDAKTLKVLKKIDMGQKLAEFGRDDLSGAMRPMALSPDEKFLYFQVSFFHGFVEYDLQRDKVTRLANLPISEAAAKKRRDEYLLDSAHHGLSMNREGTKLCVAGTVSDYAAIVDRATFATKIVTTGLKPYWSTNSGDGKYCFVSFSGDDAVGVISYADAREVARIKVGDHPQRMRMGELAEGALGVPADPGPGAAPGAVKPALRISLRPRRVLARVATTLRLTVTTRRAGRTVPVAGARVWLGGKRTTTDRRGRATIRKRRGFERVRTYRVRVTRTGYRPAAATVRAISRRR
jgi:DNA-binding beta-propeller fold protein YncE